MPQEQPVPRSDTRNAQPDLAAPQAPANGEAPDSKIDELKRTLDENKSRIAELTESNKHLLDDIRSLDAAWSEAARLAEAYKKSSETIEQEKNDFEEYYHTKKRMIDAAIKDKKDAIDKVIYDYDKAISESAKQVEAAQQTFDDAEQIIDEAEKNKQAREAAYESAKSYQKDTERRLKELQSLRVLIEIEDDKHNVANMYVLIQDLKILMDEVAVKSEEEFKASLEEAWSALDAAKKELRDRQTTWKEAKEKLEDLLQEDESLIKNRRERILEEVAKIA